METATAVAETVDNNDHPDGILFEEMRPKNQIVVPELRGPILSYHEAKINRVDATAKETEAKKLLDRLLHDYKASLAYDPQTNVYSYRVGDVIAELVGSDVLKTRVATNEDEEK